MENSRKHSLPKGVESAVKAVKVMLAMGMPLEDIKKAISVLEESGDVEASEVEVEEREIMEISEEVVVPEVEELDSDQIEFKKKAAKHLLSIKECYDAYMLVEEEKIPYLEGDFIVGSKMLTLSQHLEWLLEAQKDLEEYMNSWFKRFKKDKAKRFVNKISSLTHDIEGIVRCIIDDLSEGIRLHPGVQKIIEGILFPGDLDAFSKENHPLFVSRELKSVFTELQLEIIEKAHSRYSQYQRAIAALKGAGAYVDEDLQLSVDYIRCFNF